MAANFHYLRSLVFLAIVILASGAPGASRSPENQLYQFMVTESFTPKAQPGMTATVADAYLWIPPICQRLRGVVVLAQNVPEQWLAGHPDFRAACSDNELAILYTCRSFLLFNTFKDYPGADRDREHGQFLQQILDALAASSGYAELSTVPWLPMGESMALMVPNALTSAFPDRCIAGIQIKDGQWDRLKSPLVPVLVACGTAPEWDAPKHDIFTRWQVQATDDLQRHRKKRAAEPQWPGSLLIEAGSAHFSCTDAMAALIVQYMRAACKARLSADGSPTLRPVNLDDGFVAGLPAPGMAAVPPTSYRDCRPEEKDLPWYFDMASAKAAYDMANINWHAQPQLPVFADAAGRPVPFNYRGITGPLPITMAEDGITFSVNGLFLDSLPDGYVNAGAALGHVAEPPLVEWLCGPYKPLGGNRFQLALDRTWIRKNCFVRVWHPGNGTYRLSTNPGAIEFNPNQAGKPQRITFAAIPDQPLGQAEILLQATSDSGMPVRFFVGYGPAEIHGDRLVFTPLPPRSRLPLTVSVTAWQWGRAAEPAVQTAEVVERSFHILLDAGR